MTRQQKPLFGEARQNARLKCTNKKLRNTTIPEHKLHTQIFLSASRIIFFHPDYTVGFGVAPNHALRLVGCTTGGESHPALKILFDFDRIISRPSGLVNRERGEAAAKKRRGAPPPAELSSGGNRSGRRCFPPVLGLFTETGAFVRSPRQGGKKGS